MSLRQDRLTFFGVLVAVVIAVLGYLQLGSMYPLEGRAQTPDARGEKEEKNKDQADRDHQAAEPQEEQAP